MPDYTLTEAERRNADAGLQRCASMAVHYASAKDCWETPRTLFAKLDAFFHFTLDVAASEWNTKCARCFTKEDNALIQSWKNHIFFMNPPYGRQIGKWVQKAANETTEYPLWTANQSRYRYCGVALLPARTDTRWFHDYVLPYAVIHFLKGRLTFELDGRPVSDKKGKPQSAPFPSMLAIYPGRGILTETPWTTSNKGTTARNAGDKQGADSIERAKQVIRKTRKAFSHDQ